MTTAEEKNNIAEFKKDIISNGVYVFFNGSLELVIESNLKDLEKKIKIQLFMIWVKDGEMIKVLSLDRKGRGETNENQKNSFTNCYVNKVLRLLSTS